MRVFEQPPYTYLSILSHHIKSVCIHIIRIYVMFSFRMVAKQNVCDCISLSPDGFWHTGWTRSAFVSLPFQYNLLSQSLKGFAAQLYNQHRLLSENPSETLRHIKASAVCRFDIPIPIPYVSLCTPQQRARHPLPPALTTVALKVLATHNHAHCSLNFVISIKSLVYAPSASKLPPISGAKSTPPEVP